MSLDCPDMQVPVKQSSRDMAKPTIASWRTLKKIARYVMGVKRVVWKFTLQEERQGAFALSSAEAELYGMVEA
eukprot:7098765-Karenia_brevis.AAC.1